MKYLVMAVSPERRGVGNFEGIIEPRRWEALGEPVEADGPQEAVEAFRERVFEGVAVAVPLDGLEFFDVEREYVVDGETFLAQMEAMVAQAREAMVGGKLPAAMAVRGQNPPVELLTAVRRVDRPADEVIGHVEDLRENVWAEGASMDDGPVAAPAGATSDDGPRREPS